MCFESRAHVWGKAKITDKKAFRITLPGGKTFLDEESRLIGGRKSCLGLTDAVCGYTPPSGWERGVPAARGLELGSIIMRCLRESELRSLLRPCGLAGRRGIVSRSGR